ncbi:LuxR C-terminal-related transcriptional regulator [Streptomyces sp. NPDC057052]|uniref:LuxR C-terminal-related transcriptional regulator n=1 Tax=Streptomyces sp. NPDC057052 TaxID=3346010 RepID=UPI00362DA6F5
MSGCHDPPGLPARGRARRLSRLTSWLGNHHGRLRLVRLAASDLINRQIAERLLVSPRTVGSHLYRALPKPGS